MTRFLNAGKSLSSIEKPHKSTPSSSGEFNVDAERNFNKSKTIADDRIFTGARQVDIYCGCRYAHHIMQPASCPFRARKNAARGRRLEWEHVVPASWVGSSMACWKSGGREACGRNDTAFRSFEGDLHNLRPSVGELNGDRSNIPYGRPTRGPLWRYGDCQFTIGLTNDGTRVAEPPDFSKGDVARVTLYMADKYHIDLSSSDREMFKAWDKLDPVDDFERETNRLIKEVQGDGNPYIK